MTTQVKTVQANYTEAQVLSIVAAYKAGESLESIAKSVNKSVPSVRAKLAALKVYVSKAAKTANGEKAEKEGKANKDALAAKLSELVGLPLLNVEAASKPALLALINCITSLNDKINQLVEDMLGDDSASDDSASD